MFHRSIDIFFSVTAVLDRFLQERTESLTELGEIDSVLWSLRPGYAWLDLAKIQFQIDAVIDFALARHAKHFLRAKIIFERGALLIAATGGAQIVHRFVINRKITDGCAVLRRHVANGGAIWHGQGSGAFAIGLNELA